MVLPAAAGLIAQLRAIDLAYHVRAGELTLSTGSVVEVDPFTFTRGDLPWLNQQWGAQVVFAIAHRMLGWAGVAIAHAAALGTGFCFVFRSCVRAGARPRTSAMLGVLGFIVGANSLGARPQSLAIPLFTGTWLLLARRDRWSWLVPILAVVWANVHGSFVLAPLLAAFAVADDLVERRPIARGIGILVTTAAGTCVTPFGPAVWSYAVEVSSNETIRDSVAEWRPPLPFTAVGAPFWLSGLVVAVVGLSKRRMVRPVDVARLLVFFAIGLPALRGTLWWALATPPIVAGWFRAPGLGDREGPRKEPRERQRLPNSTRVAAALLLVLLPFAALLRTGIDPVTGAPARLATDAPEVLVETVRRHLPAGSRLFVFQPFASWFEYSLPDDPVMVDSRIELFPEAVWHDYDVVVGADEGWERTLDRYEIDGVILAPGARLAEALVRTDGWEPVTLGPAGSVFVRR